ncbi:Heterodisulfide reductase subunit D-like protein [Olavius algarvensis associated proteobacterium Delta 3]|nr:Heterodisulfide reductase subunit D-like protein [Olavius algarvensis associated proteobacterium Delta 3]CAB5166428.1 Heterodisulfide reductase subunit D-like protein [Olavius algarvensis associated proteobacterium Delta 3]
MSEFDSKIITFLCNWCSYVAADAAGVSRMTQKTNTRVIRVFCSGMVDPGYVIKAFASGADGVLVAGCHPGDCHYISGNMKALRRSFLLERLLTELGVEKGRFRLEWIAASESPKYAEVINAMSEDIRRLGPFSTPSRVDEPSAAASASGQ